MIVAFVNQKGGVGKTTLAITMACELARTGKKVLVVDADAQASAGFWVEERRKRGLDIPFTLFSFSETKLDNFVDRLYSHAGTYTHTLIDVGGAAERTARTCLAIADVALVPVEPSAMAFAAAELSKTQIAAAMKINPTLEAAFVFNKRHPNSLVNRFVDLADWLGVLDTTITDRVVFPTAMSTGQTLREVDSRSKAIPEIQSLTQEVIPNAAIETFA